MDSEMTGLFFYSKTEKFPLHPLGGEALGRELSRTVRVRGEQKKRAGINPAPTFYI
jgi:hypothetical protein